MKWISLDHGLSLLENEAEQIRARHDLQRSVERESERKTIAPRPANEEQDR